MPLNLEPRAGGDFTPYLKFNGKAGRWYTRNDIGEEVEVTEVTALFDLLQIKTGYIQFIEGEAPQYVWDSNGVIAPKPANLPKAKRGFGVNIFAPKLGGLREFAATSNGAVIAMKDLFDNQWEPAPERLEGKVPVVKCERVLPVKSKYGTNYEPVLKIVGWRDRPPGLPLEETTKAKPEIKTVLPLKSASQPKPADPKTDDDLDDDIPF